MKEIIAIIRMNKVNETKKALADNGICGMHAMKVMGRGRLPVDFSLLDGLEGREEIGGILADGLAGGSRLIPKRMLTILAGDGDVDRVVQTIIRVNSTGNKGDGKIFVCPVLEAVRVRTMERGEAAI
ncbi:MAG: P-II family nitrogen regulator [Thermoanaerobacteraceae bacterium]|nr:P-II family nitrogen regulator [Thermoanaerobacteraceae bacterium]